MARSRTSSPARGPTRSAPVAKTSTPSKQAPTPVAPTNSTPAMAPQSGGMLGGGGGIMSGIVQGMTFGAGSALGHRAIDSVLGPRQVEHVQVASETASNSQTASMGNKRCLEQYNNFQNVLIQFFNFIYF